MKTAHYVRFVQALVIASTAACSAADDVSSPPPVDTAHDQAPLASATARVQMPLPDVTPPQHADAGTDEDAFPKTSGPIAPPELPLGFA